MGGGGGRSEGVRDLGVLMLYVNQKHMCLSLIFAGRNAMSQIPKCDDTKPYVTCRN